MGGLANHKPFHFCRKNHMAYDETPLKGGVMDTIADIVGTICECIVLIVALLMSPFVDRRDRRH
jgi:hypothetical protein